MDENPPVPPALPCCDECGWTPDIDDIADKVASEHADEVASNARKKILKNIERDWVLQLVRQLRRIGKYAVPGSAALYSLGFAICVLHYHRRGVPVYSLSHAQFIAAGLLFLVLTASAYSYGLACVVYGVTGGLVRLVLAACSLWLFALPQVSLSAASALAGYCLFNAFLSWATVSYATSSARLRSWVKRDLRNYAKEYLEGRSVAQRETEPQTPTVTSSLNTPLAITLFSAVLFATSYYPAIPQWLGGGEARRVSVFWSAPPTDAEKRSITTADKDCVFEVHSDANYLYLAFSDEKDERCSGPSWSRRRALSAVGASPGKSQYVVVKRDRIASVVYR